MSNPSARPLNASEYRDLLDDERHLLRVSDGSRNGTFLYWVDDGELYWRCLSWFAERSAKLDDLGMLLDGEHTTQLLIRGDDS